MGTFSFRCVYFNVAAWDRVLLSFVLPFNAALSALTTPESRFLEHKGEASGSVLGEERGTDKQTQYNVVPAVMELCLAPRGSRRNAYEENETFQRGHGWRVGLETSSLGQRKSQALRPGVFSGW